MAAGTAPVFVTTPKTPAVRFSTANSSRDGTGTLGTLFTAGAAGSWFSCIRAQAEGTTTAGVIRVFIQAAGSGNFELIKEILVTAITPGTATEAWYGEWAGPGGFGISLGAGDVLKVGTHNAETFSAWCGKGGDY